MKRWGVGALAVVLGVLGLWTGPAAAQSTCQQIQITTTRTAGPLAITPLDGIAFPVPPVTAPSTVVRQILVCPPGAVLPPVVTPAPVLIGTPILGAPLVESPVLAPAVVVPAVAAPAPAAGSPAPASAAPALPSPAIVGAAPVDTVRALAAESERFDRTVVSVTGIAASVAEAADAHGAPITTFRLEAQGASVGVVVWGRAAVRAGERVRVSGPFYVSTPFAGASGTPWHDVIAAEVLER